MSLHFFVDDDVVMSLLLLLSLSLSLLLLLCCLVVIVIIVVVVVDDNVSDADVDDDCDDERMRCDGGLHDPSILKKTTLKTQQFALVVLYRRWMCAMRCLLCCR